MPRSIKVPVRQECKATVGIAMCRGRLAGGKLREMPVNKGKSAEAAADAVTLKTATGTEKPSGTAAPGQIGCDTRSPLSC